MTTKEFKVQVFPSAGEGMTYYEYVSAINPPMAKKIVESRVPSNWRVGYPQSA